MNGNIIIVWGCVGNTTFGNINKVSNGKSDIFIAKYNNNGILLWVQSLGGINDDYAFGICLNNNNNICLVGTFSGTVSFGTLPKIVSTSSAFVAQCNGNGSFYWVQTVEKVSGIAITTDNNTNKFVTGNFLVQ